VYIFPPHNKLAHLTEVTKPLELRVCSTLEIIQKEFIKNESSCNVAHQLNMLGHRTRLRQMKNDRTVGGQMFEKEDLMPALKNLNEAWNYLYQAEQEKIVRMLVDSVEIKENGIKLHLNLDDFDNLFVELST
jgi:hypothetical protein